jgi:hypothetical protein
VARIHLCRTPYVVSLAGGIVDYVKRLQLEVVRRLPAEIIANQMLPSGHSNRLHALWGKALLQNRLKMDLGERVSCHHSCTFSLLARVCSCAISESGILFAFLAQGFYQYALSMKAMQSNGPIL